MESGVRRWLVDISKWNPSEERFEFLASSLLPPHERPAITRFVKFEDRKRALVSRLLQYSVVHEVFGIPFEKITIHRTIEGKPYLKYEENTLFPCFNFNTSHHGDYVGIASEQLCLVGLDIVSVRKPQKETALEFIKNFSSYFTILEWWNIVHAGSSDAVLTEFYRCWCLKEAYIKAIGAGVGFGLQRLEFRDTKCTDITVYIDGAESREWKFSLFEIDESHLASVAKGHPKESVESYQRTLAKVDFEEEEYQYTLRLPEQGFILRTVEQLIPK
ncbi:uncharacterized protein [Typha latifolia]|uniref:uncharacterized protein isoform X2 n=1 Tax=Typha latifolia TaxID=4733 RepID=UPI003C2B3C4C